MKTHSDHMWSLLTILPHLTNQGKPLCLFPLSFMHDRTPKDHLVITVTSKHSHWYDYFTKTTFLEQIYIWVTSSPGRDPWMLHLASPPGFSSTNSSQLQISSLCRHNIPWVNKNSSPKTLPSGGSIAIYLGGAMNICPLLRNFRAASITQLELSSLTMPKAWGDPEKFKSQGCLPPHLYWRITEGDRVFGLSMMWV